MSRITPEARTFWRALAVVYAVGFVLTMYYVVSFFLESAK